MRLVLASYVYSKAFNEPEAWLNRINASIGALEKMAKTNEVISIEQINYEGKLKKNGVQYYFKRYPKNALRFFPLKLNLYIKNLNPDVVIIQGLHFPLQVILLRSLLGHKVKILAQHHAEKPFKGGYKRKLQQWADRGIAAYLFASRPMGLTWVDAGNLKSPSKIYEVMELSSTFYPIEKAEALQNTKISGAPVFLWVGRLNANKDPLTVVGAFLKFATKNPLAKLYMIYQTSELLPEIEQILAFHAFAKNVVLIGKIPHAELHYWFNSATYIISGSHYEGSGTAVCEAMSCRCVPIVTDIFSFRMITDYGKCGLLYAAGDQQALLTALNQTGQLDIAEKQRQSLAYFKSNLSFEAIATKIEDIVKLL
ncbi:MAG: glycosyltransferase family 4 protein [Bacteroidota bacterium]